MKSKIKALFPGNKAHPAQAGFIRRGLAFGMDALIIAILSSIVYTGYSQLMARISPEPSPVTAAIEVPRRGESTSRSEPEALQAKPDKKQEYLDLLKDRLPAEDFKKALAMSATEIEKNYKAALTEARLEKAGEKLAGGSRERLENSAYKVIKEYFVTLLYFVLFFRFGGRTPGKRLFGLKVIDLEGKPRLGWYQCFERAHGYVCSGLFASLGFWQVLWDKHGLTMHDKIADTTVIRWRGPDRTRRNRKVKEIAR